MTENILENFADAVLDTNMVDEASFFTLFDTIKQSAGAAVFRCAEPKILDGQEEIPGIYLGHRFSIIAYPCKFDVMAKENPDPVYGGVAPAGSEHANLVKTAASAWQFTPSADRGKFDFTEESPIGHPRPALEILIFSPAVGGPVTLRTYTHYNAVYAKGRSLDRLYRHIREGRIAAEPMVFTGKTAVGYAGKPLQWIDSDFVENQELADAYEEWKSNLDDGMRGDIRAWVKCEDNALTDADLISLSYAAELRPDKKR